MPEKSTDKWCLSKSHRECKDKMASNKTKKKTNYFTPINDESEGIADPRNWVVYLTDAPSLKFVKDPKSKTPRYVPNVEMVNDYWRHNGKTYHKAPIKDIKYRSIGTTSYLAEKGWLYDRSNRRVNPSDVKKHRHHVVSISGSTFDRFYGKVLQEHPDTGSDYRRPDFEGLQYELHRLATRTRARRRRSGKTSLRR